MKSCVAMTKRLISPLLTWIFLIQTLPAQEQHGQESVARNKIAIGGGYFAPSSDRNRGGPYLYGGYYYEVSPALLLGASVEYSSAESTILGSDHSQTTSVNIPVQFKYLLSVSALEPYIGAGLGLGVKSVTYGSGPVYSGYRLASMVAVLAGMMIKTNEYVHVVAELRYAGEWIRTAVISLRGSTEQTDNVGGLYASIGLLISL